MKGNKNNSKVKKKSVKSALVNPFVLEWPSIELTRLNEIIEQFVSAVKALKGINNAVEHKLSEEQPKGKKVEINLPSDLIFGYNAVMRGLEKDNVVAVLINKSAKPTFLVKSFLPICALKEIPLVPKHNLLEIASENFGIKSCLAIGMKRDVLDKENPFNSVYVSCCQALNIDCRHIEAIVTSDGKEKSTTEESIEVVETNDSPTEAKNYHLKRIDKSTRVFHPASYVENSVEDFIKINVTKKMVANKAAKKKIKNVEAKLNLQDFMFIDDAGDNLNKSKKKKRKIPPAEYVETSVKRIKNNIDRKSKISSQ